MTSRPRFRRVTIIGCAGAMLFIFSCNHNSGSLTAAETLVVRDSVEQMLNSIATDISQHGPTSWIQHFDNTPYFFMASDGQLAFSNTDSMAGFLKNSYAKGVRNIVLSWNDVRIDPYTMSVAGIAAKFSEQITDTSGKLTTFQGYFTAVAEQQFQAWRLRNAHWSIAKPAANKNP
jgi:hypothetical protein